MRYRVVGKIHTIDKKVHHINRTFHATECHIVSAAMFELSKRADKGSPWYGDAVAVIDAETNGDKFAVVLNIPYP